MVKLILNDEMVISWSCVTLYCKVKHVTLYVFSFSKHLENIRGSDFPDSHALRDQLEIVTEEVIELRQYNKKQ